MLQINDIQTPALAERLASEGGPRCFRCFQGGDRTAGRAWIDRKFEERYSLLTLCRGKESAGKTVTGVVVGPMVSERLGLLRVR